MKKYVSLILCAVLFLSAFLLNYERALGGEGDGENETVEDIEEFSSVLNDITKILDFDAVFASNAAEPIKYQLLSASAAEENNAESEYESVTIYSDYTAQTLVSIGSDWIETFMDGTEEWFVSDGGERLFVKAAGDINQSGVVNGVSQNTEMSLEFSLYYESGKGFFIKYEDLKMSGATIPRKILNKWISVDSCDVLGMDMGDLFEQLLGKNYMFLEELGGYLNRYLDDSFAKRGDNYIMKNDVYKKFCTDNYNNTPDFSGLGITFSELEDVDGELRVDLSEEDAPVVYYTTDMSYGATSGDQALECEAAADQRVVITNINNTVVRELELSSIYNIEDLLM